MCPRTVSGSEFFRFEVPCSGAMLKGDGVTGPKDLQTVLIHGAGASERGRFAPLRQVLSEHGVGSIAFDCIGHGETGGPLGVSSLASRTRQAAAVIGAQCGDAPLALIGTSMGAYNAIRLAEKRSIDALVLVVPGVYTPAAYEIPFGPEFSAIIRKERSWNATDAWRILAGFRGRLLVIAAEHDAVIPAEIPERLAASAEKASWRKLHVVPGAEHNRLFSPLAECPSEFGKAMELIGACLAPGDSYSDSAKIGFPVR